MHSEYFSFRSNYVYFIVSFKIIYCIQKLSRAYVGGSRK